MLITINGKAAEISNSSSVRDLMKAKNLQEKGFIFVLNGKVITMDRSDSIRLTPNDNVDVIRILGGG